MNLLKIVKKESFKEAIKIAGLAIVGMGIGYISEKAGLSSWLWKVDANSNNLNWGETSRNAYGFVGTYCGKILIDLGIASAAASFTYSKLDKLNK
jgi:hypothetical protein